MIPTESTEVKTVLTSIKIMVRKVMMPEMRLDYPKAMAELLILLVRDEHENHRTAMAEYIQKQESLGRDIGPLKQIAARASK